jgi:hypothetical protein
VGVVCSVNIWFPLRERARVCDVQCEHLVSSPRASESVCVQCAIWFPLRERARVCGVQCAIWFPLRERARVCGVQCEHFSGGVTCFSLSERAMSPGFLSEIGWDEDWLFGFLARSSILIWFPHLLFLILVSISQW